MKTHDQSTDLSVSFTPQQIRQKGKFCDDDGQETFLQISFIILQNPKSFKISFMLRNLIYSHQNDNEKAVDSLLELNKDDIERNVRFNLPEMGDKLLSDDADHDQPVLSMIENERLLYLK